MPLARLPAFVALIAALLVGALPWRVCADAYAGHGHGRFWVPGPAAQGCSHVHAAGAEATPRHVHGHGCGHACGGEDRAPVPFEGCPAQLPDAPVDGAPLDGDQAPHCHCEDHPLRTASTFTAVTLAAPAPCGRAWLLPAPALEDRIASEDHWDPEGGRVPREEDPIVLLR